MDYNFLKNKLNIVSYFSSIKKKELGRNILAGVILLSLAIANTPIGKTFAQLSDREISSGNIFTASTLDQSLHSVADFNPNVTPTILATRDISISNDGLMGFKYNIKSDNESGALCDYLNINASLDGVDKYFGSLKDFSLDVTDYVAPSNWHFEASLMPGVPASMQNQTCALDFTVSALQKDLTSGAGFSDSEIISNVINAGTWKIEGVWIQTTVADFNAGISSYTFDGKKEIAISPATDGTGDVSLAAGGEIPPMTAASSGDGDTTHVAANAIDGSLSKDSYWKGTNSGTSWLKVDLGKNYDIGGVDITFHSGHNPKYYNIEISKTGDFTGEQDIVVNHSYNGDDYINDTFTEKNGRYIRIFIHESRKGNPEIWEFVTLKRELPWFGGTATLQSQNFDSGKITKWTTLEWDETLVSGTDIKLEVQTSNDGSTWSAWQLLSGTSPIDLSSLPQTRYIRWRATLTSDTHFPPISTPILHEVRVHYEQEDAQKQIVMNEFLPNPDGSVWGDDTSVKPRGEWIELYNKGISKVDVAGFYFKDSANNTKIISAANTNAGNTVINPGDWLVVYMNSDFMNNGGDTIGFYDLWNEKLDEHTYDLTNACNLTPTPDNSNATSTSGTCFSVPGNKSFARIPDGTGAWVDPIPTPGHANIAENPVETIVEHVEEILSNIEQAPMIQAQQTEQAPATTEQPATPETPVQESIPASEPTPEQPAAQDPAPAVEPQIQQPASVEIPVLSETPATVETPETPAPAEAPAEIPATIPEAPVAPSESTTI